MASFGGPIAPRNGGPTTRLALTIAALATLVAAACTKHPLQAPDPQPVVVVFKNVDLNPKREVDILFNIDTSLSMVQEQDNLARNFPQFMQVLGNIVGGLPDIQVGIITPDLGAGRSVIGSNCIPGGERGSLRVIPGCGVDPATVRYLSVRAGGTAPNFPVPNGMTVQQALESTFGCLAKVGTNGCGQEHHLQATRVALYDQFDEIRVQGGFGRNAGFLRRDAFLAIVIIADEDDCSAPIEKAPEQGGPPAGQGFFEIDHQGQAGSLRCSINGHVCNGVHPPAAAFSSPLTNCQAADASDPELFLFDVDEIVSSIRALKPGRPDKILVSAITGWPDDAANAQYTIQRNPTNMDWESGPACTSADGDAAPAVRLKKFVDAFGENGLVTSICNTNLGPALMKIGQKLADILQKTCIDAPLYDTNPATPAIEPDCRVIETIPVQGGAGESETLLRQCGSPGAGLPCWRLKADATCGSGFQIDTDRGGVPAPQNTLQKISCLTVEAGADGGAAP